ncbi:cellulose biosynthesis cyclic di-GMP-binding regulatory protein BcsB [Rhizobium sp. SSA_523]|uniref:cellulose biosynthesis cyclic di-GMP-binding regulatory protein BcsB n=1 Tax=Rhizobium sp. SSA_523 TaxID=2952477 RepID=UPI0020905216|nr:cellulose biosynthesis cyclic di-GMP-binding regulatory protein BcsB [Rhizobium sp. SSA_523]MCO5734159.1 cellulose biosynthesis cyclic di-GMP-binding regulatory protein BcsB [Rhizobium sp. SSA_523]WKC21560.1 cellulose biosynthesis cyclic di-GMP-binding regulatory protein BcsB [Rhizobium sp. SSA_523]
MEGQRRYLIPSESVALSGEYSRRAWSFYLTSEQAKASSSLHLAYQNAIVVAPEASTLSLFINNRRVGEEKISAPTGVRSVRWVIPAGLLRPGSNDIELLANQRHRTDCDIRSTYDLWTEIDSAETYLQFAPDIASANSAVEAVNALGADAEGLTHFQMVVPSIGPIEELSPLLKLSQGLSVMSGMPNPQFSFQQGLPQQVATPGRLTIAIGTAAKLQTVVPAMPPGAETGPVSAVTRAADGKSSLLVFTGPTWAAVSSAIDAFLAPVTRPPSLRRDSMSNERWVRPNAPFVFGGERLSFAQLGIPTSEFAGRRFRVGFDVAVPSDFYAGAYGEATLYLDAAYGASVAAGSHIDVYVNGNIASTVPVTEEGGGILRQSPIRITMRHLRPGINHIELEAILLSKADSACVPGSNASADARFALFDTSTFHMPDYARIGQTPNLSALSGTGFPYSRQQASTALFMDRIDADMLSAAANFFGKTAQISGAPIPIEPVSAANAVGGRNAIYIGSAGQLPTNVLSQLNLDPDLAAGWTPANAEDPAEGAGTASMEAWRNRLQGGYISQSAATFQEWLQAKLDFSEGALRFLPGKEVVFRPDEDDDLLLAQGTGVNGAGIWTVLTAPNSQELRLSTSKLVQDSIWQQIEGRVFSYARATNEVSVQEARMLSFLPPINRTLQNYRLIAANWLSSNLLSYALAIVLASCLLGATTATLLRWLGRRR